MSDNNKKSAKEKMGLYVSSRVFLAVVITVVCLWAGSMIIKFFSPGPEKTSPYQQVLESNPTLKKMDGLLDNVIVHEEPLSKDEPETLIADSHDAATVNEEKARAEEQNISEQVSTEKEIATRSETAESHDAHTVKTANANSEQEEIKPVQDPENDFGTQEARDVRGSAFALALIEPLDHELNERTFGWRPNDIFSFFTDNVENYQLGVLEVTRRASITLVERIARTGSNITFDKNLDSARTKFMNDPKKYWLPAPEDAYSDALEEIEKYRERLNKGKATFHARADNLVPLLEAFESLLGDCDESLVKRVERNGSSVSTFMADDYYYYSKGVAKAMATVLHAVMEDFAPVLDSRGAAADLHHAIRMLDAATELEPLFVQESSLSGLFANHRANMATFISHARSYVQFVIKTMTT